MSQPVLETAGAQRLLCKIVWTGWKADVHVDIVCILVEVNSRVADQSAVYRHYPLTFVLVSSKTIIIRWTLEILLGILWLVSTIPYMYNKLRENFNQTHVHDCMYFCKSFWPGNGSGSECRFAHKLQKFLGDETPKPPPCARTQGPGCSVSRLPLFWLTQLSDSSRAPVYRPVRPVPRTRWTARASVRNPRGTPKWALTDSDAVELTRTEDDRSERYDVIYCRQVPVTSKSLCSRSMSVWWQTASNADDISRPTTVTAWRWAWRWRQNGPYIRTPLLRFER